MDSTVQAVPIQPGKTQAFRDYVAAFQGPRRGEEESFHRRAGIHREAAWVQHTPQGDLAIIYWEGEDAEKNRTSLWQLLQADEDFGAWVRERFVDIYGLDPDGPMPPPPERVMELRIDCAPRR